MKAYSDNSFDETIDIRISLGTNPNRSDQNIRGSCIMPGGLGKTKTVIFFGANE